MRGSAGNHNGASKMMTSKIVVTSEMVTSKMVFLYSAEPVVIIVVFVAEITMSKDSPIVLRLPSLLLSSVRHHSI